MLLFLLGLTIVLVDQDIGLRIYTFIPAVTEAVIFPFNVIVIIPFKAIVKPPLKDY
jgi:hypothetical protein